METGLVAPAPQPQAAPSVAVMPGAQPGAAAAGTDQAFNAILQQTVGQQAEDTATVTPPPAGQDVDAQLLAKLLEQAARAGQLVQSDAQGEGGVQVSDLDAEADRLEQIPADQTQAAQLLASYLQAAMRPAATPQQAAPDTDARTLTAISSVEQATQIATDAMQSVGLPLDAARDDELTPLTSEAATAEEIGGRTLLAQADALPGSLKPEEQPEQPIKAQPATVQPKAAVVPSAQAETAVPKTPEHVVQVEADASAGAPAAAAAKQQASGLQSDEKAAVFEGVTVQKTPSTAVAPVKPQQSPDVQALVAHQAQSGEGAGQQADQQPGGAGQQTLQSKSLPATASEPGEQQPLHASAPAVPQQVEHAVNGLHLQRQEPLREVVVEPQATASGDQVGRQVAERLNNHTFKQGNDQITLKLSPEHLGNLQLNVRMDEQRLRIEVVAEQRGVRDALLQQVDELKETLARRNITMDSFDVTTSTNGGLSQQASDWRQTASERRPQAMPYYAGTKTASAASVGTAEPVRYFAPQYQSTLDVRF